MSGAADRSSRAIEQGQSRPREPASVRGSSRLLSSLLGEIAGVEYVVPAEHLLGISERIVGRQRPAIVHVIVSPPLRGDNWLVGNGCCDAFTAHRGAVLPVNGALHAAERFAIDFVQATRHGLLFSGPADSFSSYPRFGDPVPSATSGRVVRKVDNFPETPLGGFPPDITAGDAGGNYLVIAIGGGRYAFYAHMQPGSIAVRVGHRVRVGQMLGRLGNSGNSDGRHLHFHIMDGPSPLASNGLPFRLNRFIVNGKRTNLDTFSTGQRAITIPSFNGRHRNELPLNLQFIDFR
jgi:hypothetical protein